MEDELLRLEPIGGPASSLTLSIATANLNSRIRVHGLSSRKMLLQRDQFTNQQIPFSELQMTESQHKHRTTNHPYSERAKAPSGTTAPSPHIEVGSLVYLHGDRNESCARSRYLVMSVDRLWCIVRKFVGSRPRECHTGSIPGHTEMAQDTQTPESQCTSQTPSEPEQNLQSPVQTDSGGLPTDSSNHPKISPQPHVHVTALQSSAHPAQAIARLCF